MLGIEGSKTLNPSISFSEYTHVHYNRRPSSRVRFNPGRLGLVEGRSFGSIEAREAGD